MKQFSFKLLAFAASVLVVAVMMSARAQAQGGAGGRGAAPPQPPMVNLQFFPKDTPRPEIFATMQGFTQALGVGCDYCHMFQAGSPNNDLSSDVKPTKKTARVMLAMVRDINMRFATEIGKPAADVTRVGCVTCHRGVPVPKALVDIVTDAATQGNAAAGLLRYRDLRKQFFGAQAYDFSENTLIAAAQRAVQAAKADDAIAYLEANLEFFPNSARTYQALSQAYQRKGDKAGAVKSLQKAIELDPNNPQYKNQLQQLNGA